MNGRIKQPKYCEKCGALLVEGECGKGFCPNCKTYTMHLEVNFSCKGMLR